MQERALNCLKNLLNGKAEHIRAVAAWAADQGNPGSGLPNLLAALAAPLQPTAPAAPAHARQALFAISNICSGNTPRSQRPSSPPPPPCAHHLSPSETSKRPLPSVSTMHVVCKQRAPLFGLVLEGSCLHADRIACLLCQWTWQHEAASRCYVGSR